MKTATMERPAILGGPRAVTLDSREAKRWPILTEEDRAAVLDVLDDGDLSCHPVTRRLEDDYRETFGMRHALAHSNGTAALLAAFFALDLNPGDEVLAPTATFWASVVPMLWVGAVPVFCESEPERGGLDPEDAERRITPRTRAMVVTHLWGMPARIEELVAVARRHGLAVIEDASHAHGASVDGRKCGSFGDIAAFSLQTSKLAPAGEGGIFLTNNDAYYERAILMGDIVRIAELQTPAARFAATSFGIKTRLSPLSAAIARAQLKRLAERNARRNAGLRYLSELLERLGFHTFLPPAGVERVYYEFLVRHDAGRSRLPIEDLVAALRAEGCEAGWPRYPLLHQQPLFTEGHFSRIARLDGRADVELPVYRPHALPKTEVLNSELVRLPAFPRASAELLDQYATAFEKIMAWREELIGAACCPAGT